MDAQMTLFAKMSEADRKLFIAELFHYMWYDEDFFKAVNMAKIKQEIKGKEKPVFFPDQNII